MLTVPLIPTASQKLTATLGGQVCNINCYQKLYGLFVDLYVNGSPTPMVAGVIGLNTNRIVRYKYLGFVGDLSFFDTQGSDDPDWTGLGSRFLLLYLDESDLATLGIT